MAYRVIADFADALDKGHIYRAGDIYPRSGKPSELRVAELSGYGNRFGHPLIEAYTPEEKQQDTQEQNATEEKPKRGRPRKAQ